MPPPPSKKAEALRAETKKLDEISKKKLLQLNKLEKTGQEKTKKDHQQIEIELERIKKKTNDALNGKEQATGWDDSAVVLSDTMKHVVQEEARFQHELLLKVDQATNELELKAKTIRKELPMVSDFSEEDRVHLLSTIDKAINKLREKRSVIEAEEIKLNKRMQVIIENTPDPTENKEDLVAKLQFSYDVMIGANDPDRARNELLKVLSESRDSGHVGQTAKKQTPLGHSPASGGPARHHPPHPSPAPGTIPQNPSPPKPNAGSSNQVPKSGPST